MQCYLAKLPFPTAVNWLKKYGDPVWESLCDLFFKDEFVTYQKAAPLVIEHLANQQLYVTTSPKQMERYLRLVVRNIIWEYRYNGKQLELPCPVVQELFGFRLV